MDFVDVGVLQGLHFYEVGLDKSTPYSGCAVRDNAEPF